MIYVPKNAHENEQMAEWAAKIIKQDSFTPPYMCMGFTRENKMACVVVAHDYRPPNVFLSFASLNPHWASRQNLEILFERWVFEQLKCSRITGIIDPRNDRSRKFTAGVGFKLEGTLRRARQDGGKLLVYGLIREDFRKFIETKRRSVRKEAA